MHSTLKAIIYALLGLSLSYCSLFGGGTTEEKKEEAPEQYSSSGVYKDIEAAGNDRALSSEEYSDDDYGTLDTGGGSEEDDIFLSDSEGSNQEEDSQDEPAPMGEPGMAAGTEPLPVETLNSPPEEEPVSKPVRKKVSSKFKNGMYSFKKSCNMRKKPSTKGRAAGKVPTDKKLWVEGHNASWVKVQKKSGPVYVHRSCL